MISSEDSFQKCCEKWNIQEVGDRGVLCCQRCEEGTPHWKCASALNYSHKCATRNCSNECVSVNWPHALYRIFDLRIFDLHIFAMPSNICKTCFGHRLGLLLILGRHVLYTRSRRLWYGVWHRQTQWKTPYRANLRRRRCVASQVAQSRSGTFSWGPYECAQVVGLLCQLV